MRFRYLLLKKKIQRGEFSGPVNTSLSRAPRESLMDCGGSFLAPGSSSVAVVISSQLNASECSYIRTSLCAALSVLCLLNSCHLGLSAVSSSQQCQRALPGCPSLVGPCLAAPPSWGPAWLHLVTPWPGISQGSQLESSQDALHLSLPRIA